MLPIGAKVKCSYNEHVTGTIVGYGIISEDYEWWPGCTPTGEANVAYLVALKEKVDLTKTPMLAMLSVMVIEKRHTEEIKE